MIDRRACMRAAAARPRARRAPWHRAGRIRVNGVAWCVVHGRPTRMHGIWFSTRLSVSEGQKRERERGKKKVHRFPLAPRALSGEAWSMHPGRRWILVPQLLIDRSLACQRPKINDDQTVLCDADAGWFRLQKVSNIWPCMHVPMSMRRQEFFCCPLFRKRKRGSWRRR